MFLSYRNLLAGLALLCLTTPLHAQNDKDAARKDAHGSGKIVQEQKTLKPFDALEIKDFHADVIVEVGGTASTADIRIDETLRPYLRIEEENGRLKLSFPAPEDHPFRMNKSSVTVTLRTPTLKRLSYGSNNDITVNGLRGDNFSLAHAGNGTVTLRGKVTTLEIASSANGSIRAEELTADKANVVNQANAGVRINAKSLSLVKSGNGSVTNVGEK
ncbi:MAG: DUF2807 domain-containing protein [Cytophagales bacterium]|nr:DUF2807 domain-containing protein [Cytophagales bacterium]